MKKPGKAAIEQVRATWARVAKEHGWYDSRVKEMGGFYVHIWVNRRGEIMDSIYQHPQVRKDTISRTS